MMMCSIVCIFPLILPKRFGERFVYGRTTNKFWVFDFVASSNFFFFRLRIFLRSTLTLHFVVFNLFNLKANSMTSRNGTPHRRKNTKASVISVRDTGIADIFSNLTRKKENNPVAAAVLQQREDETVEALPPAKRRALERSGDRKETSELSGNRATRRPTTKAEATAPRGDGLYHEASSNVSMNDDAFFAIGATARRKKGDGRGPKVETFDGCRVITEKDLGREVDKGARNKKDAHRTPNCPFDCDCCF